ncbi:tRNA (adenine(22)-N(1))-methyltransferase [Oenococcus oeni]|uniref:tRNA (adenine(22)-N(1))-methyltransferase n=1 Tax=Oenococcus oeni TaxID=1247 RepID=UPI0008F83CF2|nr:class I SAM-dependent methyltransferase [Oenococcus oeni]OIK80571.1 SAM-dependent methyltransferase [Oenococcus oeni]OIL90073.1 SAM-dependent methyltransferase [Oenococcus oeni]
MTKLSDRLMEIYRLINQAARVADIGTDHAAIPIALLETNKSSFLVATDIGLGPLEKAKEQIELADLDQAKQIVLRLGDGLSVIKASDKIDTVVIAGMGGELIAKIISKIPDYLENAKFILQPNNEEIDVRKAIEKNGQYIETEKIIYENRHFYEIIVAKRSQQGIVKMTNQELRFGPCLLKHRTSTFKNKWQERLDHSKQIEKILEKSLQTSTKRYDSLQAEIKTIEEVLK